MRKRATESYTVEQEIKKEKQRRQILLEEQHENFVVVVRKREMLAAINIMKMSGSEKKVNKNT